jgi:hypothetical protein
MCRAECLLSVTAAGREHDVECRNAIARVELSDVRSDLVDEACNVIALVALAHAEF